MKPVDQYSFRELYDMGDVLERGRRLAGVLFQDVAKLVSEARALVGRGFDADDLGMGDLLQWRLRLAQYDFLLAAHALEPQGTLKGSTILRVIELLIADQIVVSRIPLENLAHWRDSLRPQVEPLMIRCRTLVEKMQRLHNRSELADRAYAEWLENVRYRR